MTALVVVLGGWQAPASAYTLEGPKWPGQPSPGYCCIHLYYRNFAGDSIDFNAGTGGANAWSSSSALVYIQPSTANVVDFYEANISTVGWDGLTQWSTYIGGDGKTYFQSGMTVRVNHYYLRNYSTGQAQSVAAHEFGHALGLGHAGGCVLMNGYTSSRYSANCGYVNTPQFDDVNGADALY